MKTSRTVLCFAALLGLFLCGCGRVVPPGKTVIILHPNGDSEIIEKGVYRAWGRAKAYYVDHKLQSFTEDMKVLCADDINMQVDVKTVLAFDVSGNTIDFIKQKVPAVENPEGYMELSLDRFYKMVIKDVVRGSARNVISPNETDTIRPQRRKLESEIARTVKDRINEMNFPVSVSAVLISNIDYPESVKEMRQKIKQAKLRDQELAAEAEAKLAEAQRQVAIETEAAKVRMVKAQAQADENRILTESLTPQFLMWRQFEVLENLADKLGTGPNNTVFLMPYSTMDPDMLNTTMLKQSVDALQSDGGSASGE